LAEEQREERQINSAMSNPFDLAELEDGTILILDSALDLRQLRREEKFDGEWG
jgi:hypothetical protein